MRSTKNGAQKNTPLSKTREEKSKTIDSRILVFFAVMTFLGLLIWGVTQDDTSTAANSQQKKSNSTKIAEQIDNGSISATMSEIDDESSKKASSIQQKSKVAEKASDSNNHSNNITSKTVPEEVKQRSESKKAERGQIANIENKSSVSKKSSRSVTKRNKKASASQNRSSSRVSIDPEALAYFAELEANKQAEAFHKTNADLGIIATHQNGSIQLQNQNYARVNDFTISNSTINYSSPSSVASKKTSTKKDAVIYSSKDQKEEEIDLDQIFEDVLFAADGTIIPHSGIGYNDDYFPLQDTLPWHPYISLAYIKEEKETFVCEKVRKMPSYGDKNPLQAPGSLGDANNKIDYGVTINPN